MNKPLNCDETKEIRTVLNIMKKIYSEAEVEYDVSRNELSFLVLRYMPMIEKSFKNFVDRSLI